MSKLTSQDKEKIVTGLIGVLKPFEAEEAVDLPPICQTLS
jgi:hypothetical protein